MISYAHAPVAVRADLPAAHRTQWERLARAGTWLSGAERVAIAGQVRAAADCALCRRRHASLSPYAGADEHAAAAPLSAALVDVVHRVTTDPGRLTKAWFDRIAAAGVGDGPYVEAVGVVVGVVGIDSFCRGIGVAPFPLPAPLPGEPSRRRPAAARLERAWVPMLPNGRLPEPDADLWNDMPGGQTGYVVRALSLVPDEVRAVKALSAAHYLSMREMMRLDRSPRTIDRGQIELVAGRVSALRGCFY